MHTYVATRHGARLFTCQHEFVNKQSKILLNQKSKHLHKGL